MKLGATLPLAVLAALALSAGCTSRVQLTVLKENLPAVVIGHIENRDLRFSPYDHKNFADMLAFELMRRGYEVEAMDFGLARKAAPIPSDDPHHPEFVPGRKPDDLPETYIDSPEWKKQDPTSDLLPAAFQDIAGEKKAALSPEDEVESHFLRAGEIRAYQEKRPGAFFVQGAIGRTESGLLLEMNEDTLIFLDVHGPPVGRKIAAISVVLENRSIRRADLLQKVSVEIADQFAESVGSPNAVQLRPLEESPSPGKTPTETPTEE